ncbi:lasso peptide biosynthesis B2 protein [Povalibacter sp.]|uniref:lasso peptide biosynthesis B2 protein n=1 Tax=Povalibacter sp. TaxID=1962978 RepID=UPI002F3F711F
MIYQLPAHVRMCHTARGPVFLDLKHNRYFGLALAGDTPLRKILNETTEEEEPAPPLIHQLVRTGLIEPRTDPCSHCAAPAFHPATISFLQLITPDTFDGASALRFIHAYLWARHAMHRRLWDVMKDLEQRRQRCDTPTTAAHVAMLSKGFHRLRPYTFTARNQCLLHALALLHYLASSRIAATWMIGVHTQPWGAHSWVQWQDMVLDATPEQALRYTPILIA